MPAKHFYFSTGALLGTAVVVAVRVYRKKLFDRYEWFRGLYRIDRDWFLYFPAVIGLFGLSGLSPDILYATGILPKPVIRGDFFNLFLGYSWFESVEDLPEYRFLNELWNWCGEAALFFISIGILVFYIRLANSIRNSREL
ncbi:MAG: hypothetical protein R8K22_07800 [Mariprofundaceae bacterium]